MAQRITNHSKKPAQPGLPIFILILIILPLWTLVSCYTTIDRQNYRFSEAESVSDPRAYRDDEPDLPVPYQLLASIPEYSNTLVLEGSLSNFYSLRDFAEHQHYTVCLYDPHEGVLGFRKQVPESKLELIVFYRLSGRYIKVNAFWRSLVRGYTRHHSAIESERAPTMWASADNTVIASHIGSADHTGSSDRSGSADRAGSSDRSGSADRTGSSDRSGSSDRTGNADRAGSSDRSGSADRTGNSDRSGSSDRPVRRSDNPESSDVNRGRVVEPRSTGNAERRPGQDESSRQRDGEARQTNDRRTNDNQSRENRRETAPSVPVYPLPSPSYLESVRPSSPRHMPTMRSPLSQPWLPAILQEDVFSDHSVAFAHMLHFIHQSPYDDIIRYEYIRLDHELPANDPCNIEPRYFW